MPLQETTGAASYDAYGGGPAVAANYIEDVFSTWLYTGNSSTQTITNGIDLSGKGGLVWAKCRSLGNNHMLFDTARGSVNSLCTNNTNANAALGGDTSFNSNGYSMLGTSSNNNTSGNTYVSWTFRKQPKFFDVVTYTGNGSNRTIAHNLGSVPGCIIVKRTDTTGNWQVYHRSNANTEYMVLNSTAAKATGTTRWNSTTPTATEFSLGTDTTVNANTGTYVAYLFAHNAGGFGASGTDNVISCGSFTAVNGVASTVNLGWEPQWLLMKISSSSGDDWKIFDNMRGLYAPSQNAALLKPNTSEQEYSGSFPVYPTATGFTTGTSLPNATYIYIAIRRGPMRTPTTGTSVYNAQKTASTTNPQTVTTGFVTDLALRQDPNGGACAWWDRLRGNIFLQSSNTNAETANDGFNNDSMTGWSDASSGAGFARQYWGLRRAPGFFDVVCWSATAASTQNHNLQVVPELAIFKYRTSTSNWWVYSAPVGLGTGRGMYLNGTDSSFSSIQNPITAISSSTFSTGLFFGGGGNWVTYLFATVAGVSKVGSYTGNGSSQTINCGFTGGSRFVMIKRTDSTGDWYVWDSARGIVAGNDPHLSLNSTAAEVTTDDSVDTDSTGFVVNQVAATNVNVSSATYIFLAIA